MSTHAIEVSNLGKRYRLGGGVERYSTLRDTIAGRAGTHFRRLLRREPMACSPQDDILWALRSVSFTVDPGEVVGVIGRNGAGKSTLLKILSRITDPTEGWAEIHGRVGSLLEVGTGFHNELTGAENLYLNGAILGMSKAEIERQFEAIVEFAEVRRFINTPVKHYSSGMYLRLAFAVAAHLQPEILLVDEVLAVGDAAFQKKCLGKMEEVAETGRTVLFVSHNMGAVTGLCRRAIWIDGGSIRMDGDVHDVTQAYLGALANSTFSVVNKRFGFTVQKVSLRNQRGEGTTHFSPGDDLVVDIPYLAEQPIRNPYLIVFVKSLSGACFVANSLLDGHRPAILQGQGVISCAFRRMPLLPQSYTITIAVKSESRDAIIDHQEVASFTVAGDLQHLGFNGEYKGHATRSYPVMIPYTWTLPDGSQRSADLTSSIGDRQPDRLPRVGGD